MFKSLREKLGGITKKLSTTIEEETADERALPEEISQTEADQSAVTTPSEQTEVKKTTFTKKVSTLLRDREVYIKEKSIEEPLFELEMILLENDVAYPTAEAIIETMKEELTGSTRRVGSSVEELVTESLRAALLQVLGKGFSLTDYIDTHEKPVKVLFTGVNGVGKTTTIAKIAHYLRSQGYSVVIGSGDTYRAGANQQMLTHAERIGVKVIQHQEGGDPSAVLFDTVGYAKAHNIDVVLADTAGRFHNRTNLMKQLEKMRRVMEPDIIAYVDEAVAGNDAVVRAEEFNNAVGADAIVLTKADMDPKGGAAISIAHTIGKPVMFLGVGQGYDDVIPFDSEAIVADLLEGA